VYLSEKLGFCLSSKQLKVQQAGLLLLNTLMIKSLLHKKQVESYCECV